VRQEIAKFEDRIVEIVTEDRFPQMLSEDTANWAAAVENTAIVSWTGPQLVSFLGVIHKCAEKGCLQGPAYCFNRLTRFLAMNSGVSSAKNT
jgi:hypothetical protein